MHDTTERAIVFLREGVLYKSCPQNRHVYPCGLIVTHRYIEKPCNVHDHIVADRFHTYTIIIVYGATSVLTSRYRDFKHLLNNNRNKPCGLEHEFPDNTNRNYRQYNRKKNKGLKKFLLSDVCFQIEAQM